MQKALSHTSYRGFVLVDVLVSSAILLIIMGSFVGAIIVSQRASIVAGDRARAAFLAEEGLEGARNIRDANFNMLSPGTYGLSTTGNQYGLSGSSDTSDMFTRTVEVTVINSFTKQVTSNVTWNHYVPGTVRLTTYLVNTTLLSQADTLTVNTSAAARTGLLGTSVSGIVVTNTSVSTSTIQTISLGGLVTTQSIVIAPGATVSLGTLSIPVVSGLLPIVIMLADQSTKALNLSL